VIDPLNRTTTDDPSRPLVTDPAFVRSFIASYTGPYGAEDALWWIANPDQEAPSGAQSPYEELKSLSQLSYSREGTSNQGLLQRIVELENSIAAIRQAAASAIAATTFTERAQLDTDALPSSPPPERARSSALNRRRAAGLIVALAACALVGFAVGAHLPEQEEHPVPDRASQAVDKAIFNNETTLVDRALMRTAVESDRPPVSPGPDFVPESIRRIEGLLDPADSTPGIVIPEYFVGKDTSDRLCLIAIHEEASSSQCVASDSPAGTVHALGWSTTSSSVSVQWSLDGIVSERFE